MDPLLPPYRLSVGGASFIPGGRRGAQGRGVAELDWAEWHLDYDEPGSLLSRRLELVQAHLRAELDRAPAGGIRLISLCAGQGRGLGEAGAQRIP